MAAKAVLDSITAPDPAFTKSKSRLPLKNMACKTWQVLPVTAATPMHPPAGDWLRSSAYDDREWLKHVGELLRGDKHNLPEPGRLHRPETGIQEHHTFHTYARFRAGTVAQPLCPIGGE